MKNHIILITVISITIYFFITNERHIECTKSNESDLKKLFIDKNLEELKKLEFDFEIISYSKNGKHTNTIKETPTVAIQTKNGWILGNDRGERGGALLYRDNNGNIKQLLKENIANIYSYNFGYIILTGIAHKDINKGAIYLVKEPDFKIEKIHTIKGAPDSSWLLSNGDLLINMYDNKSAILKKDNSLEYIQCKKP